MTFGQIVHLLPQDERHTVRHLEKLAYKINAAETAAIFNETCIQEGLLPKYTNLRLQGPQAANTRQSAAYRRSLVQAELVRIVAEAARLKNIYHTTVERWSTTATQEHKADILSELNRLKASDYVKRERTVIRKLVNINGGKLYVRKNDKKYVNLTEFTPSTKEDELLQLGLSCHYMETPKQHEKALEIELLLDLIYKHERNGKLLTSDDLPYVLLAEAAATRGDHRSKVVTRELRDAAKSLRERQGITVRRADKAAAFVLINTEEYHSKIDDILSDTSKFARVARNPTDAIRSQTAELICRINSRNKRVVLPPVQGDYSPGYIYGNVKTHKPGNPLRPIISQCPTPTYTVAKALDKLLQPFVPSEHCFKSSAAFIQHINGLRPAGIMSSMDVESLFTNVPVDTTIDMILEAVYRGNEATDIGITEDELRELLCLCTKAAVFVDYKGQMWSQINGVAMGSPLGVLFANMYMGTIERRVFAKIAPPAGYGRYIDDTFQLTASEEDLHTVRREFESESGLRFTFEFARDRALPYMDVAIQQADDTFHTSVYVKSTNIGTCLSGKSECPSRYRHSAIDAYIRRSDTHCSTPEAAGKERARIAQMLVNNGYSNKTVRERFARHEQRKVLAAGTAPSTDTPSKLILPYRGIMSSAYHEDEKAMRKIINDHVAPADDSTTVELRIYYKTQRTSQLVMKNSPAKPMDKLKKCRIAYKFSCPVSGCTATYIGKTSTTLGKRISNHSQGGAVQQHLQSHGRLADRKTLVANTDILATAPNGKNPEKILQYLEALLIKRLKPSLNTKEEYMFLPSMAAHNALKHIRPDMPSDPAQVRCRNGNHYTPSEAIARTTTAAPAHGAPSSATRIMGSRAATRAAATAASADPPAATTSAAATSAGAPRRSGRARAQIR